MLALIVDTDIDRAKGLGASFGAAGNQSEILGLWVDASARLIKRPRPDVVIVAFSALIYDGISSVLAAEAQLKILKLPHVIVHAPEEVSEVNAVSVLCDFQAIAPSGPGLTSVFNQVLPGAAASVDSDEDEDIPIAFEQDVRLAQGTRIDGRYEIVGFVAAGGMGNIYRAKQLPLGRLVALKVMRSDLSRDSDAIARFQLEAQTVSRLVHPHTITLFDYGIDEHGQMYLAMEWLEGESLSEYLQRERSLSPKRTARIAAQTSESLAEAHQKGIIHRDLKPGNIFLVSNQVNPDYVKVLDFGIAKIVDNSGQDSITIVGTICGTPEFMSPEQARGKGIDGRSDLYSLGCCAYAMLMGAAPFVDEIPLNVIIQHQSQPLPALPQWVPQALRDAIDRCVRKRPEDRYANATEAARAFAEVADRLELGEFTPTTRAQVPGEESPSSGDFDLSDDPFGIDAALTGNFPAAETDGNPPNTHEEFVDIPEFKAGQIAKIPVPRLLYLLWVTRRSGTLTLTRARQVQTVEVVEGEVADESSKRSIESVLGAFAWNDGTFAFEQHPPLKGVPTRATLALLNEGLRLHYSVNQAATVLANDNEKYPASTNILAENRSVLEALGGFITVIDACTGKLTLGALMMQGLVPFEELCRGLILGAFTDCIVFLDAPAAVPIHVEYKGLPGDLSSGGSELKRLLTEKLHILKTRDPYEVFGLSRGCTLGEIRAAYAKFTDGLSREELDRKDPTVTFLGGELRQRSRALRDELIELERADLMSDEHIEVIETLTGHQKRLEKLDPYEVFGLWPGCGRSEVETAFFKTVKKHHPDQNASTNHDGINILANKVFMLIQEAYAELQKREPQDASAPNPHAHPSEARSDDAYNTLSTPSGIRTAISSGPNRAAIIPTPPGVTRPVSQPIPRGLTNPTPGRGLDFSMGTRSTGGPTPVPGRLIESGDRAAILSPRPPQSTRSTGPNPAVTMPPPPRVSQSGSANVVSTPAPPPRVSQSQGARVVSTPLPPRPSQSQGVRTIPTNTPPRSSNSGASAPILMPAPPRSSNSGASAPILMPAPPRSSQSVAKTPTVPPQSASRAARPVSGGSYAAPAAPPARMAAPAPPPRRTGVPGAPTARPVSGVNSRFPPTRAPIAEDDQSKGNLGKRSRKMSDILAERAAKTSAPVVEEPAVATPSNQFAARPPSLSGLKPPEEHYRAGMKFAKLQQMDQAEKAFAYAHKIEPDNGKFAAYLAWSEYMCDPSKASQAKAHLKEARKTKKGSVEASYLLGTIALAENDLVGAKTYFESVITKRPNHTDASTSLRVVKGRLAKEEDAKKGLFTRIVKKVKSSLEE